MIGIFDSGVGGLSVLREIEKLLPASDIVYFGDTAHVPYGPRSAEEILSFSIAAVEFLQTFSPAVIVIACNTATSVAIEKLRQRFPGQPLIGVVPVVKTLAERSRDGRGVVIATQATLNSPIYEKLKKDFASHMRILELPMPTWVEFVERGELDSPALKQSIREVAEKIRGFHADVVALGSTHFPWLRSLIEAALPGVVVLDSGGAVARQTNRVLTAIDRSGQHETGVQQFWVSGDAKSFAATGEFLLGRTLTVQQKT